MITIAERNTNRTVRPGRGIQLPPEIPNRIVNFGVGTLTMLSARLDAENCARGGAWQRGLVERQRP
jgi:hypothetical protein